MTRADLWRPVGKPYQGPRGSGGRGLSRRRAGMAPLRRPGQGDLGEKQPTGACRRTDHEPPANAVSPAVERDAPPMPRRVQGARHGLDRLARTLPRCRPPLAAWAALPGLDRTTPAPARGCPRSTAAAIRRSRRPTKGGGGPGWCGAGCSGEVLAQACSRLGWCRGIA